MMYVGSQNNWGHSVVFLVASTVCGRCLLGLHSMCFPGTGGFLSHVLVGSQPQWKLLEKVKV